LITHRWKQCPHCKKRYGYEAHSGGTKGWEVEYFGSPTETCPNCFATIGTRKVQKISDLETGRMIMLGFSILFENLAMLVWITMLSFIVSALIGNYADNNDLGIFVGIFLFAFMIFKSVRYDIREFRKRK
jgi:hypothetical protein